MNVTKERTKNYGSEAVTLQLTLRLRIQLHTLGYWLSVDKHLYIYIFFSHIYVYLDFHRLVRYSEFRNHLGHLQ